MIAIAAELGDAWPACADDLTPEIRDGLRAHGRPVLGRGPGPHRAPADGGQRGDGPHLRSASTASTWSSRRATPTSPSPPTGRCPSTFGGVEAGAGNNGRLTFPANLHGNPAISIPAGHLDGLPIGLQVVGRHFTEPLLLELAHIVERNRPWPLIAPAP